MSSKPTPQPSSRYFVLVFGTVVALSVMSLGLTILFGLQSEIPSHQQQILDTCSTCWKLGFGAIVGMISGKTM